jgi:hypothetical protein
MSTSAITRLGLKAGDVVEVRSEAEILATLDENGALDALPFMPEMLRYAGKRLVVGKVAHRACDTLERTGVRKMNNAVHLDGVRCDGAGHDGCEAACMIYWKLAWLKKVDSPDATPDVVAHDEPKLPQLLQISSRRPDGEDGEPRWRCQATEMRRATPEPLPVLNLGQYVEDVRSGNIGPVRAARTLLIGVYNRLQDIAPQPLKVRGGKHFGQLRGKVTGRTPTVETGLQPGDLVRIKSREEIEATITAEGLNRGMGIDGEMARFCGRTARVARRINRILDEHTGKMLQMRSPCIVLEDVVCEGAFNACPRQITAYWREIWLEKIESASASAPRPDTDVAGVR